MKKQEKLLCVNKRLKSNLVYNNFYLTIKNMKEILTDKMLQEIFTALVKGETYGYSDGNVTVQVSPNSIQINCSSTPKRTDKDIEVAKFLEFCDNLHDDLFVEVCESFADGELDYLQKNLDTDNYRETIKVFTTRAREIAGSRLAEIIDAADAEIRKQESIIQNAQAIITDIHSSLDEAHAKYSI